MATAHSHVNGGATSGPNSSPTLGSIPTLDTAAIFEMLGLMKGSLATIGQQSNTLNEQGAKVEAFGPNKESLDKQAKDIEEWMKKAQDEREERIGKIRSVLKDELKKKIATTMQAQIREQIKTQVAEQVKAQLGLQIRQHLPEPLAKRVEESRRQIEEVTHAFQNSEARSRNSTLKTFNLDDQLDEVLKPDGTHCDLYPTNLRSLFAYSGTEARQLAAAYKLGEHHDRERNINQFMAHIGIPFPLLWVAVPGAESNNETTTPVGGTGN